MSLLIAGLLLFTLTHLMLSAFPALATAVRNQLNEPALKMLVALPSLAGIWLIVSGWKSADATVVYSPSYALRIPASALIAFAMYLFVVSNRPSSIKRIIRHPQLTGVALWAAGHLLLNGDSLSVTLFTGLGVWAVLEILLINRRDGAWIKPESPGIGTEAGTLAVSLVFIAGLVWAHEWFAGVAILGGYGF